MAMRKLRAILMLGTLVGLAACRSAVAETTQYAGQLDGSQTFIAVATNGTDVQAYVCDGAETSVSIAQWFKGTLTDDAFDLTAEDGAHLAGQVGAAAATGTLTLANGSPVDFSAALATGDAGLYRQEATEAGDDVVRGWIVLATGETRGATIWLGRGAGPPPPPGPPPGGVGLTEFRVYYYYFR